MKFQLFSDTVVWQIGPVPVCQTVLTAACVSAAIVAAGTLSARVIVHSPDGRLAAAARMGFRSLGRLIEQTAGHNSPALEAFAGGLFLFISVCSLAGQLPGVRPPTANLATTSALAALVFFAVPVAGIHARGVLGFFKHNLKGFTTLADTASCR